MANKTVRMYGKAYGENVNITAKFNNTTIVNGIVTSVNEPVNHQVDFDQLDMIVEFVIDTAIEGVVPFELTVNSGGDFVFHTFQVNHSGNELDEEDNIITAHPNAFNDITHSVSPDSGRNNIVIAGEPRERDYETYPEATGIWNWTVGNGETMTMDITVSPTVV